MAAKLIVVFCVDGLCSNEHGSVDLEVPEVSVFCPASALQRSCAMQRRSRAAGEDPVRSPSVGGMPATVGSASCAAKWCSSYCQAAYFHPPDECVLAIRIPRSHRIGGHICEGSINQRQEPIAASDVSSRQGH